MTDYFVGTTAAGLADGSSWDNRYGSLNDAEDTPLVAGDDVIVGPGSYREMLTCDVSGALIYDVGTCNVTNGSDQVTGNGTAWLGVVQARDYFHIRFYATGNDGVTNGTATFTSAGGNFQADMVGRPVQIMTKGAYTVAAFVNATTITLGDPSGLGWPAAGAGLTYSIMSGEGHYEIESVDDNTTLTLVQPWQGRTLTQLDYLTCRMIRYIADVTGHLTDGVGGAVRITGSDDDKTAARTIGIEINNHSYRVFQGFTVDTVSNDCIYGLGDHIVLEDLILSGTTWAIRPAVSHICMTVRRVIGVGIRYYFYVLNAATDNVGHVFETILATGPWYFIRIYFAGGMTFRNISVMTAYQGLAISNAISVGQCIEFYNSTFFGLTGVVLRAAVLGEIIENYNSFWQNNTDRVNVAVGANSVSWTPLFAFPILHAGRDQLSGFRFPPPLMGALSQWSQIAAITGLDERDVDLYGVGRPATASKCSWGAAQRGDGERDTATTYDASIASLKIPDARRAQFKIPVSGAEITVSVYVNREVNYAGVLPQMVIKQPGQADRVTTDAGGAGAWNELTDTFTPAADPEYIFVELVSNNTAVAGNYAVYFDDLSVDASPELGTFDVWFTDRIVFDEVVAAGGGGAAVPIFSPSMVVR